jgi:hypothetical protein
MTHGHDQRSAVIAWGYQAFAGHQDLQEFTGVKKS